MSDIGTISFIGDSITFGYSLVSVQPPPEQMMSLLGGTADNEGANGASTTDWAQLGEGKLLTNALTTITRDSITQIAIMLGTNDAKPWIDTSVEDFVSNMQFIITTLVANGVTRIVLNAPPSIKSAPTPNGIPDVTSTNANLVAYQNTYGDIAAANSGVVVLGDLTAYNYYAEHPGLLNDDDGIHPNDDGATHLATLWANAYIQGETPIVSVPLAVAISSTDMTITVIGSVTNASGSGIVTIDSEQIAYVGNSNNQFFGLTRGYNGTTAVGHTVGSAVAYTVNMVAAPVLNSTTVNAYPLSSNVVLTTNDVAAIIPRQYIQVLASDPGAPTEGVVWYNMTTHLLKYYDGTAVRTVAHV